MDHPHAHTTAAHLRADIALAPADKAGPLNKPRIHTSYVYGDGDGYGDGYGDGW
jgi:hypothetical protein